MANSIRILLLFVSINIFYLCSIVQKIYGAHAEKGSSREFIQFTTYQSPPSHFTHEKDLSCFNLIILFRSLIQIILS